MVLLKKGAYHAKIKNIENKLPDITDLATNTILNAKLNEVKNEIPGITSLATTAALISKTNEVKSKIPNISTYLPLLHLLLLKIKYLAKINISLLQNWIS